MQEKEMKELIGRLNHGDRELYEERAAIREFDGLQPREHAEALALLDVLRLRPAALLGVRVLHAEVGGERRCALLTGRSTRRLRLVCEADLAAVVSEQFGGAALLSEVPAQ
jgi:hypothetical protein